MKDKKDQKKSKYIAPVIRIDTITTEHWIAAHSEAPREAKKATPRKKDGDKNGDGKESW